MYIFEFIVSWVLVLLFLLFFGSKFCKWAFEFIDDIVYIIDEKRNQKTK